MKSFKKISIRILLSLLVFVFILAGSLTAGALWAFYHPKEAFQIAEKYFLPEDLKISWDQIHLRIDKRSSLDFSFDWRIEKLLIQKKEPFILMPIDGIRLHMDITPLNSAQRFVIHDLTANASQKMVLSPSPKKETQEETQKNPFQILQDILTILHSIHDKILIEQVQIKVVDFEIPSAKGPPLTIKADLHKAVEDSVLNLDLYLQKLEAFTLTTNGRLDLAALNESSGAINDLLKLKLKVQVADLSVEQDLQLKSTQKLSQLKSLGFVSYKKDKTSLRANTDLSLDLSENEADLILKGDVNGIPGPLVRVQEINLSVKIPLEEDILWAEKPSAIKMTAPIELFFVDKTVRKSVESSCQCRLPENLKSEIAGNIWFAALLNESVDKKTAVDTNVSLESLENKILSLSLDGNIKIIKEDKKFIYEPTLNSSLTVFSFQVLRKVLEAKRILIPAPFSVLDGRVSVTAKGAMNSTGDHSEFPITVQTDLSSTNQKINATVESKVTANLNFNEIHFDILAKIQDLRLELPPLDPLRGLPRVVADSRILKEPVSTKINKNNVKLSFSFQVLTTQAGGIQLLAPYFKPSLPVSVDIQSQGQKENSGYVQTEPFSITYLRRTVSVEKLRLELSQADEGLFPVQGRFKIQQTQYTVFIDLAGTTKNPQIKMSSDPYLPESEIISVLLYDRTSDQLISADAETAGSVQAAMADRAIGIFGLWAFASTPIKSFSYNPATKIYAATVAVTDDVSASVGTNWEEATHLELRKRISRRWMLTAAWTPATQDEKQSSKLVLQWERRF